MLFWEGCRRAMKREQTVLWYPKHSPPNNSALIASDTQVLCGNARAAQGNILSVLLSGPRCEGLLNFRLLRENNILLHLLFSWQKNPSDFCLSSLSFQWKIITFPLYPPFSVLSIKHHSSSAGVGLLHRCLIFLAMPAYSGALSFKSLGDTFLNN